MKRILQVIMTGCALGFFMPAVSQNAHADILPWLATQVNDPFHAEKKAKSLVEQDLKPDHCGALPGDNHKLTFEEVVIASLCHNPDAIAAYFNLLNQASSYMGNYSEYLPTITASGSRTRTKVTSPGTSISTLDPTTDTIISSSANATTFSGSYDVSAGLTLYDFGQREFKIEIAELSLAGSGMSYNSTLQGMIASALQAYYALLTAQNALGVTQESEQFAKESYDAAALRHQIGQVPLADELQAKASYSGAQLATEQAVNQLTQAQAALALLMGLPADTPLAVADIRDDTLANDPFGGNVQSLMAKAKQSRLDLLSSRLALKSSEISLKSLERSDFATVSATANMDVGNDKVDVFNRNGTRSNAIGVNVSIPIFTGFSQLYSERAARESLEAQKQSLIKTELTVEQDVWNSWHNYETAKLSWKTSQDQFDTAVLLKDVTLGRYKEGLGSILDVLNAETQYSSALQSRLQTRYSLLTSRIDLVRAVGVLNLDTMCPQTTTAVAPAAPTAKE